MLCELLDFCKVCTWWSETCTCLPTGALRAPGGRKTARFGPKATHVVEIRKFRDLSESLPAGSRAFKKMGKLQEARRKAPQQDCGSKMGSCLKRHSRGRARHNPKQVVDLFREGARRGGPPRRFKAGVATPGTERRVARRPSCGSRCVVCGPVLVMPPARQGGRARARDRGATGWTGTTWRADLRPPWLWTELSCRQAFLQESAARRRHPKLPGVFAASRALALRRLQNFPTTLWRQGCLRAAPRLRRMQRSLLQLWPCFRMAARTGRSYGVWRRRPGVPRPLPRSRCSSSPRFLCLTSKVLR